MTGLLLGVIYMAFISLGLPDSLLGAAWPGMYPELAVPVSFAGIVSMIIALGTVVSSLESDRVTKLLGAGRVTAVSVVMTAAALWGFSTSTHFWQLCLWAVPYGLGAGSVDAALNNYVALHFAACHMNWLHCMWGVGASIGPYVMGYALAGGWGWPTGYRAIGLFQFMLAVLVLLSLPLWKKSDTPASEKKKPIPLRETLAFPGVKEAVGAFFCCQAVEQTAALWAASYLVLHDKLPAHTAAGYAGLFYLGMTAGRAAGGFLADEAGDRRMTEAGLFIAGAGVLTLFVRGMTPVGLLLVGLGCAPVYPGIVHATPRRFGEDRSQAVIGVEMAGAYLGTMTVPPLFGLAVRYLSVGLLPVYLGLFTALAAVLHRRLIRKTAE